MRIRERLLVSNEKREVSNIKTVVYGGSCYYTIRILYYFIVTLQGDCIIELDKQSTLAKQ